MTQISSYYASVGVQIDKGSIAQVSRYLNNIEKQLNKFQSRLTKSKALDLMFKVDRAKIQREVTRAMRGNNGITITAKLSQSSLTQMQNQVRMALSGITISPNINARVRPPSGGGGRGGSGGGGGSHRGGGLTTKNPRSTHANVSPWHNPMMIGGGVGAFMRYGPYSLPLVAGAFGLNALSNKAALLQGQELGLDVSLGSLGNKGEADGYRKFLSDLGDRLGKTTESMTPFFAQMLSGAKGTDLEPHLQTGFASLMEFGSVMGLGSEAMKGTIKAFTQMIGKQQIMAEELRGQAAEHMPPVVRMMAEAVTGGDIKKLNKMMEKGELDPSKHLPLLFQAMRENATPFMEQYFKTITFWQGKAQKNQEDWLKKFLGSGGTEALASFYKTWSYVIQDSIPYAEKLGRVFKSIVHYFNAAMLAPGEIFSWIKGEAGEGNFMSALFGNNDGSFGESVKKMFTDIGDSFNTMIDSMTGDMSLLTASMDILTTILGAVAEAIGNTFRLLTAYQTGGMEGVMHEARRQDVERQYKAIAKSELDASGMEYNAKDLRDVTRGYMMDWDNANAAPTTRPSQGAASGLTSMGTSAYGELKDLYNSGNMSIGGIWDILNKDRSDVFNPPSSVPAPQSVVVRVIQDPLQVNAQVEARTDAEAIANEIDRRMADTNRAIYNNVISNSPMTSQ